MGFIKNAIVNMKKEVKNISTNIKKAKEEGEERRRARLDKELEDLPKQIELEEKRLELERLKRKRVSLSGQNGLGGLGGFVNPDSLKIDNSKMFQNQKEQLDKDKKITFNPSTEPMIKHPELKRDQKPFSSPTLKKVNKK